MSVRDTVKLMTYSLRLNMLLLLCITFGSFAAAEYQKSFAASVKSLAIIEDDLIRAKDLFDGLDRKADKVIGPAPLPGKDMVLNARTLLRIAVALDLSWRPESGLEKIVIRRAATIIDPNLIEDEIMMSLADKGVNGNFQILFDQGIPTITLPQTENASVQIGSFDYDPTKSFFQAELIAPSLDNPIKRQFVSGRVQRIIQLPVLNNSLKSGQIISVSDINWVELPAYKVQSDFILSAEELVGMTSRRLVMAGEPLRHNQIIEPILVKRGESVTISYQAGAIELVAEGKALQNGARGDTIRVVNYSSNRTIDATIENQGRVIVN